MSPIIRPSKTMAEKVLAVLESDIISGRYKPGDRMVENEIAASLGVSRGPVREALLVLKRRGLIKEKKGNAKGREVTSLSKRDLEELYQVRIFLETQCLIHHALQGEEMLAELNSMVQDMDQLVARKDIEGYRKANAAFHHAIVRGVRNDKLYEIYKDNDRMLRWFQAVTLYDPRLEKSNEEHKRILAFCRRRDLAGIARAMNAHQVQALALLLQKLNTSSDAQDMAANPAA